MKGLSARSVVLALVASTFALPAAAVPITATFSGIVTGGVGFSANVLSQFPVGTTASFNVTFDDSPLVASAPVVAFDLAPVSGSVQLGALQWFLDAGAITSYSYSLAPGNPIINYGLQLTGTGPSISGGAGSLFGLFLRFTPSLDPVNSDPFLLGFRFPFPGGGGESYGYASLSGTSSFTRGTISVPEPNTLVLSLIAFLLCCVFNFKTGKATTRKFFRSQS